MNDARDASGWQEPPEEMLSGYLDGTLVQQDRQRVELWLERSAEARELLRDLRVVRLAGHLTYERGPDLWREADAALERFPQRGSLDSFNKAHLQARVQLSGRRSGKPEYEFNDVAPERGLFRLPCPNRRWPRWSSSD